MKSEKRPIEIEDLLRLKRAERPPSEFWSQFDRELRAKQLSALVAKRPWWHGLSAVFSRPALYRLPLGAAAALAVTIVTVRQIQQSPSAVSVAEPVAQPTAAVASAPASSSSSVASASAALPPTVSVEAHPVTVASNVGAIVAQVNEANIGTSAVAAVNEPARESFLGPASRAEFAVGEVSSSSFGQIGTPLTVAPVAETSLARGLVFQASTGFEARALPTRAPVEPLQQITPPGERTRAKLLMTAMMSMTSVDVPNRTGERAADRLSEKRLYDQVHRFGARGAGVSMKF